MKNIGWLFYKEFYVKAPEFNSDNITDFIENDNDVPFRGRVERNTTNILRESLNSYNKLIDTHFHKGSHSFTLNTVYPGLLVGSGYIHEMGIDGEFKLGFFFDWTTGLPIIPGSSVKGALRSVFEQKDTDKVKFNHRPFLKELLNDKYTIKQLEELKLHIFEGKDSNGKPLPMSKRDIFYDAFPYLANGLFSEDFVTPHKNPLKNPIPLKFLKVQPNVTFFFPFRLRDTTLSDGKEVKAEDKLNIFKIIIKTMGLGSKTNVGYGNFE